MGNGQQSHGGRSLFGPEENDFWYALVELVAPQLPSGLIMAWEPSSIRAVVEDLAALDADTYWDFEHASILSLEASAGSLPAFPIEFAQRVLELVPTLAALRFRLVPARIKEEQFWQQFFEQIVVRVSAHVRGQMARVPDLCVETLEETLAEPCLFVDDSAVYRPRHGVSPKTGNREQPAASNGVLLTLNPQTGILFAKVFHSSRFEGASRVGKRATALSRSFLCDLLSTLPVGELPRRVICADAALVPLLREQLGDTAGDTAVMVSALQLCLAAALQQLPAFRRFVESATADDIQTSLVFCSSWRPERRFHNLVLLLRALATHPAAAFAVIFPGNSQEMEEQKEQVAAQEALTMLWPQWSSGEWGGVQNALQELLLTEEHKGADEVTRTAILLGAPLK